jgi:hypothetical protein
MNMQSRP